MLHESWTKRAESYDNLQFTDRSTCFLSGVEAYQLALLTKIKTLIEDYGTDQADMNLYDFKKIVEELESD